MSNLPGSDLLNGDRDVVMSCRVRLARNVAGFPFVGRATHPQRREVLETVRAAAGPDEASVGLAGGRVGADAAERLAARRGRARELSLRKSRDLAPSKVSGSRFPRPNCTNS